MKIKKVLLATRSVTLVDRFRKREIEFDFTLGRIQACRRRS
jgi:hypothetical protein